MYKRFFGIIAIMLSIICVTQSSFTTNSAEDVQLFTFEYDPPAGLDPYSEANVKNVANWDYTTDNTACNNVNTMACKIYVPSAHVGTGNTLLNSIAIQTGGSLAVAYVTQTAAGTGTSFISNRN